MWRSPELNEWSCCYINKSVWLASVQTASTRSMYSEEYCRVIFLFSFRYCVSLTYSLFPSLRLVSRWVCQGQKTSWSSVSYSNVLYRSSDISKLRSKSLNLLNSHSWNWSAAATGARLTLVLHHTARDSAGGSSCCFFSQSVISLTFFVSNEAK